MVVLDNEGGIKLILHMRSINTVEVYLVQSSNRGTGVERLELKDSFLFKNKREFVELIAKLLNGERDSFVFSTGSQDHPFIWELDHMGASGYLMRLYFYQGKVKCSFIITKSMLTRFYQDLLHEFKL